MSEKINGIIHRFEPGASSDSPTLLLLHGTGGDENDLLGVGRSLAPEANLLSPRGPVLENGMPRFFRRFAQGVFDEQDIKLRAKQLANFIAQAAKEYGFDANRVIAFGYSNGANIAAAVLLLHPDALAAVALLRPMVPLIPQSLPDLHNKEILINSGRSDPMGSHEQIQKLIELFHKSGAARIERHDLPNVGHGLVQEDLEVAELWLKSLLRKWNSGR